MPARRLRPGAAKTTAPDDAQATRAAAIALLARRDFASRELSERLIERGFEAAMAASVVTELLGEGVLDDGRYAQNYVTYRAGRGQGPVRIAAELRRRGLAAELIEAALATGPDWRALARKVCRAKFGSQPASQLGRAGTTSTLFAVPWLFVGSYPRGHGRRAGNRIYGPLNKPSFMTAADVRSGFLEFFRGQSHMIVPSSSLVPANDPTLLFTNAGMVQFKDVFLGKEQRDYLRAASAQRCVRAGGKHNDLENVGYTARHHTFFEMLGNFSFGDYFKREAIHLAWDFLIYTLQARPCAPVVHGVQGRRRSGRCLAEGHRREPGALLASRRELEFLGHGRHRSVRPVQRDLLRSRTRRFPAGRPGSVDEEGDRYVEIWNLVFMQFDRQADGTMTPLPKPSVDTGMGLERITAVMQGVHSNYDIDLFKNLIRAAGEAGRHLGAELELAAGHCRSHPGLRPS